MGTWKRARQTIRDVEEWGRKSADYQREQRVKRGEIPPPRHERQHRDKGKR